MPHPPGPIPYVHQGQMTQRNFLTPGTPANTRRWPFGQRKPQMPAGGRYGLNSSGDGFQCWTWYPRDLSTLTGSNSARRNCGETAVASASWMNVRRRMIIIVSAVWGTVRCNTKARVGNRSSVPADALRLGHGKKMNGEENDDRKNLPNISG